jgi:hypothetical protein
MNEKPIEEQATSKCPACGGPLQSGYLLGQHSRIRWATSNKGLTIFHGVPLIRKVKSSWQRWFYAPNVPSHRCTKCQIVITSYDNTDVENYKKEYIVTMVFGVLSLLLGTLTLLPIVFMQFFMEDSPNNIFLLYPLFAIVSVFLFIAGLKAISHARSYCKD